MAKIESFVAIEGSTRKKADFEDFAATRLAGQYYDRKGDNANADEKVIIGQALDIDASTNKLLMSGEVCKLHFDILNNAIAVSKVKDAKKVATTVTLPLIGITGEPVTGIGQEAVLNDEFLFARINGELVSASKN